MSVGVFCLCPRGVFGDVSIYAVVRRNRYFHTVRRPFSCTPENKLCGRTFAPAVLHILASAANNGSFLSAATPLFFVLIQHALGQTVQKSCPEYGGPRLGVKQTEANKREWTPEQQQQQVRVCCTYVLAGIQVSAYGSSITGMKRMAVDI